MITGRAEEVVKRREHELTRSLLAETCTIKDQEDSKTYSQVKVFSFAMKPISKTDLLNQQLERSDFSKNGNSLQTFLDSEPFLDTFLFLCWSISIQVTALHLAVKFKTPESILRALIAAGADIEALDSRKRSPLYWAVRYHPAAVKTLVLLNARLNTLDENNHTPLYWAAWFKRRQSIVFLCENGADPHLGYSPLKVSVVDEEMKALIKKHASAPRLRVFLKNV